MQPRAVFWFEADPSHGKGALWPSENHVRSRDAQGSRHRKAATARTTTPEGAEGADASSREARKAFRIEPKRARESPALFCASMVYGILKGWGGLRAYSGPDVGTRLLEDGASALNVVSRFGKRRWKWPALANGRVGLSAVGALVAAALIFSVILALPILGEQRRALARGPADPANVSGEYR